jgi:LysR family glycine cleavage system transcriptional activator
MNSTAYDRLPLNALRVFEAVATRLSFAAAADVLHVTPAAVSMQIKTLEDYLQVPLFLRSGRKVQLTAEGEHLLPGVRRGLDELESALNQLRQDRRGGPLNVSMLASFLQKWLLPRLEELRTRHPELELRVHTGREQVDFTRSDFHAAIRLGSGSYKGLFSEKLMDEWLVPVAAPSVLAKYGPLDPARSLDDFPMLQGTDEPWIHWFEVGGKSPRPVRGSVLDDSVSVLLAAQQGLGFALVRWSLAAEDVQTGKLLFASQRPLPYRWAYHFVCPDSYLSMPKVSRFREWLRETARAFPSPMDAIAGNAARPGAPQGVAAAVRKTAPASAPSSPAPQSTRQKTTPRARSGTVR